MIEQENISVNGEHTFGHPSNSFAKDILKEYIPPSFESNQQGVYDQINTYFTEQEHHQKSIKEARDILGETASKLTDDQVYELVTEMQYLVDTWVEEFEQKVFEGKTLKEVIENGL